MRGESSQLRDLGERLAREQDELLARAPRLSSLRLAPARRASRSPWAFAAVAAGVLLVAAGAFVARPRTLSLTVAGQPGVPGSWIAAPSDAPVPIRFSDGTEIALAPEGHARVIEVTRRGAHFMLESGAAALSVVPKPGAHWTVSVGPYTVEVKGTRFEIGWSPQEELLTLRLTEGKVAVSGCALGDARLLLAGETLSASCRDNDFRVTRTPLPEASSSPSPLSPAAPQPQPPAPGEAALSGRATSSRQAAAPAASWQALARAGKFREAFEVARQKGFEAELDRAGGQDLLLLGDAARLSGNAELALRAYQRARLRAPGTPQAANAAFAMGRVYFDQMDAFADAARWFATYSAEQRDGPLVREALGRQMEALSRAGDHAGAARAADQYLRQYPKGPHAPLARTLATEGN